MSLLSDEELDSAIVYLGNPNFPKSYAAIDKATTEILDHIDALTAQLERTRNMVVALEQENHALTHPDPGADEAIAQFDQAAKAALLCHGCGHTWESHTGGRGCS